MSTDEIASLDRAVFRPDSVALVGLSADAARPAGRPLRFLRAAGFAGRVYPINPNRTEIDGGPVWPSLADLPEVPEHVFILLGTDQVADQVAEAARLGVRVATVLADGFAESGEIGAERQAALVATARAAGMRLIGPNAMGLADLHSHAWITVNAVYAEAAQLAGRTALLSQSGSMIGGLISRSKPLGLGFSRAVAVGNEADLGIAELGLGCVADPNTDVILLFLETLRNPDGLLRLAQAAHAAGKPIIALKLGRSAVGTAMAVAHTGALMSEDSVADAFLRDAGIARVTSIDGLIEAPTLFRGQQAPATRRRRVGVVTTTGGGAAAVSDSLALGGLEVTPAEPATLAKIADAGLPVAPGPVADLTLAGARPDFVRAAVEAMVADPGFDFVVNVSGSSARLDLAGAIDPIIAATGTTGRLGVLAIPEAGAALSRLHAAGVPAFRTPESCTDAVTAFLGWTRPRVARLAGRPGRETGRVLDEAASGVLLASLGVAMAETVETDADRVPELLPFAFPVVAKAVSDALPHKTEAGGVRTGIADRAALVAAVSDIRETVRTRTGISVDRILIAPHLSPVQEVLVGYARDPLVGPVITVAPGGVLVGLTDEKALRLAPVDLATATGMIASLRALAPLRGHRGRPPGDVDALARLIVALSQIPEIRPDILEAEANPVMVMEIGAVAADALVTLEEPESSRRA